MSDYAYCDLLPPQASMLEEVLAGLSLPQKQISPKFFYDRLGCELFERICALPEYYPTRTELAIMRAHAPAMARALAPRCVLIEIGCGNSEKTRLLLEAAQPLAFIPVDIAREQLEASCRVIADAFPGMAVVAVRADFSGFLQLPLDQSMEGARRVLYFPGSTIGNFTPEDAREFLRRWAPQLGRGGAALIGVDLKKDPRLLDAAYDDAQGVTAQFNLNVLRHINAALGARFDPAAFRHRARYVEARGRVEMHLESLRNQQVQLGDRMIELRAGETIHTENSCKYSIAEFQELAAEAGFEARECWTDDASLFAVHYLVVADAAGTAAPSR